MKRLITTMIFVVIMSSALGTYVIPRTITVDALTLNALRSSLLPASPAYDPYIADLSDSDDMVIPDGTEILPTRAAPDSVYDPTCGSAGMLLLAVAHLKRQQLEYRSLKLYGQERNLLTSAIGRRNLFLHGVEDFEIIRGDTLFVPALVEYEKLK